MANGARSNITRQTPPAHKSRLCAAKKKQLHCLSQSSGVICGYSLYASAKLIQMCVYVCVHNFEIEHVLDSFQPSVIPRPEIEINFALSIPPLSAFFFKIPFLSAPPLAAAACISHFKKKKKNHPTSTRFTFCCMPLSLLLLCVGKSVLWIYSSDRVCGGWLSQSCLNGPSIYHVNRQPSVSVSFRSRGGGGEGCLNASQLPVTLFNLWN